MRESVVIAGSLGLAILSAGIVALLTGSHATFLGGSPVGVAVYLVLGIGLPQYLLSRESGSSLQLGLAALAVAGAVVSVLVGFAIGAPTDEWPFGIALILLFVVVGNVVGAGVREFRTGYRSGS